METTVWRGDLAEEREERRLVMLIRGHQIHRFQAWEYENLYEARSQHSDKEGKKRDKEKYAVLDSKELGMVCSCPDNIHRNKLDDCKHGKVVELRRCRNCESCDTEKRGIRKFGDHELQALHCKNCGSWFSLKLSEEHLQQILRTIKSNFSPTNKYQEGGVR